MAEPNERSNRIRTIVAAIAVFGAIGGVAFWAWRERAPLARGYRRAKQRRDEERGDRGPNPEREPGTDPV